MQKLQHILQNVPVRWNFYCVESVQTSPCTSRDSYIILGHDKGDTYYYLLGLYHSKASELLLGEGNFRYQSPFY